MAAMRMRKIRPIRHQSHCIAFLKYPNCFSALFSAVPVSSTLDVIRSSCSICRSSSKLIWSAKASPCSRVISILSNISIIFC